MGDNIKGHLDVIGTLNLHALNQSRYFFPKPHLPTFLFLIIIPLPPYNLSQKHKNQALALLSLSLAFCIWLPSQLCWFYLLISCMLLLMVLTAFILSDVLILPWTSFSSLSNPFIIWPPEYLYQCKDPHVTFLPKAFCGLSLTRRRNFSLQSGIQSSPYSGPCLSLASDLCSPLACLTPTTPDCWGAWDPLFGFGSFCLHSLLEWPPTIFWTT